MFYMGESYVQLQWTNVGKQLFFSVDNTGNRNPGSRVYGRLCSLQKINLNSRITTAS